MQRGASLAQQMGITPSGSIMGANATGDLAPSDQMVSDAQLNALQNYYGGTQEDAFNDYQADLADGTAPTSDMLGIQAPSIDTSGLGSQINSVSDVR
jgi:hypothetical protein